MNVQDAIVELITQTASSGDFDDTVFSLPSQTYGVAREPCESPTGSDISLTTASAWEAAIEAATPGARIFLAAGTYTIPSLLNMPAGTAAQRILIKPNNCAAVTVDGRWEPDSYNTIAGFTITRTLGSPSTAGALSFPNSVTYTGVIIRNNTITTQGPHQISFNAGTHVDVLVEGNDLRGQTGTIMASNLRIATHGVNGVIRGNRFGLVTAPSNVEDSIQFTGIWYGTWTIEGNWFESNTVEEYIDVKGQNVTTGSVVTIRKNYFNGPGVPNVCVLLQNNSLVDFAYSTIVQRNYFHHCPIKALNYYIATAGEGNDDSTLSFQYNIVKSVGTTPRAIELNRDTANVQYNTFLSGTVEMGAVNPDGITFQNNIFYESNFSRPEMTDTCSNNLFFTTTNPPLARPV